MNASSLVRIDDRELVRPNGGQPGVSLARTFAARLWRLAILVCCTLSISAGSAWGQTQPSGQDPAARDAALEVNENKSQAETASASDDEQFFSFAFQQTPWPDVLRQFAQWNDLTLDLTDVPEGAFSYIDNRRHTAAEAIDVLNGYLLPRGYALVRRDRFLAVMKTDNPLLSNLVPTIPVEELYQRGENELLRVVVPLKDIDPESAAEEVAQLLGAHGSVAPLATSQSLVVQGFGRNLRDVVALLGQAVPPATDDKLDFRAFPLAHVPAVEAEQQIRQLFGLGSSTVNVSRARAEIERESYYRSRDRRRRDDDDDRDNRRETGPVPLLAHLAMNMQVSALPRNNCLLVTATPAGLQLVEQVLTSIDVPQGAAAAAVVDNAARLLRVYAVEDADTEEVTKTLEVIMPGVVVNEDGRHDTIHVMATPKEHAEVAALIRTLDGGGQGGRTVEVIPLSRFEPYSMSLLLGRMFENEDKDERPVIQAEPRTNTLVVRGTGRQVAQVRVALAAYGEEGGAGANRQGSRFRSIAVDRAAAEPVARFVQEILQRDRQFENPIRVVVPSQSDTRYEPPIDDRSTRSAPDATTEGIGSPGERPAVLPLMRVASVDNNADGGNDVPDTERRGEAAPTPPSQEEARDSECDSNDTATDGAAEGDTADGPPRVNIEVRDGQLYLYSADETALDEVEATVRELLQQMPDRTRWTVFYLRAAEAAATATQLFELMYDYSSPALGGFGALTENTAADSTGDSLRIIPDPRTNALFVSGSDAQVAEIQRFLKLLDSVELPESARDRLPRAIFVQYADVNEMADMIRTLYQDFLTDPAAQRRDNDRRDNDRGNGPRDNEPDREQPSQRDEPRGSGGRGPQGASPGVRLTLAVDELTSQLIVSCDEPLFRQIAKLVKERDEAARGSRPTMRMVRLGTAAPANLVEILENMSPKITTRTVVAPTPAAAPGATGSPESRNDSPSPRDRSRSTEPD